MISQCTFVDQPRIGGPSRPIENATVVIVDENGVTYPYEYEDSLKYYLPNDSFVGVPGIAYQLTVMLEGEVFQSTFETMPASGGIDRSEVQFARETLISDVGATTEQHILRILTTTQLPRWATCLFKVGYRTSICSNRNHPAQARLSFLWPEELLHQRASPARQSAAI